MKSYYHDKKENKLYILNDGVMTVLDCISEDAPTLPSPKESKKKYNKKRTEKELADEADQRHGGRRLDPGVKTQIEGMPIEGLSVAAILEKVEVSAPTVYVIKTRLQHDGRL
jgi:hypothetical protein